MFHPWEDCTSHESAQSKKVLCSPAGLRASRPETPAVQPGPPCAIRGVTSGTMLCGLCGLLSWQSHRAGPGDWRKDAPSAAKDPVPLRHKC